MVDKVSREIRRKTMQAVKSTHTALEDCVINELWRRGIRFRRNVKDLPGKPDIAIKKYKIVIFVDSCFWHKCPLHYREPKTNKHFWKKKICRNLERDLEINNYYEENGWHILRIWEHQIKKSFNETIIDILDFIEKSKMSEIL